MKTQNEKVLLGGVSETLLIPLHARYIESRRADPLVVDRKAVEIIESIDIASTRAAVVSLPSQVGVVVRTLVFDDVVIDFMWRNPEGVVVNIGCGLDARFERLDNGQVTWYDIDLPEIIELRRRYFSEIPRNLFLSKSFLDPAWMDDIPAGKPMLVIAEGVMMYFEEKDVRLFFARAANRFTKVEFLIDVVSELAAGGILKHPDVKKINARFLWGIDNARKIEKWVDGLRLKNDYAFFDFHVQRWPVAMRVFRYIPPLRGLGRALHFVKT